MRVVLFLSFLTACGTSSVFIPDATKNSDDPSGGGHGHGADASASDEASTCPPTTKSEAPTTIGEGPAPARPATVQFDVVNTTSAPLYFVNDDGGELYEMLDIAGGGTKLSLSMPEAMFICAPPAIHDRRFLSVIAPGETANASRWSQASWVSIGKQCVVCQTGPDPIYNYAEQYGSVVAAPGTYTATIRLLDALPSGCQPAADGFSCPSWPGIDALAAHVRSSNVDFTTTSPEGWSPDDQHVAVRF
jgi:hypothetical protein